MTRFLASVCTMPLAITSLAVCLITLAIQTQNGPYTREFSPLLLSGKCPKNKNISNYSNTRIFFVAVK